MGTEDRTTSASIDMYATLNVEIEEDAASMERHVVDLFSALSSSGGGVTP